MIFIVFAAGAAVVALAGHCRRRPDGWSVEAGATSTDPPSRAVGADRPAPATLSAAPGAEEPAVFLRIGRAGADEPAVLLRIDAAPAVPTVRRPAVLRRRRLAPVGPGGRATPAREALARRRVPAEGL